METGAVEADSDHSPQSSMASIDLPPLAEALVAQTWQRTRFLVRLFGACFGVAAFLFGLPILLAALDPRGMQWELAGLGLWAMGLAVLAAWAGIRLSPGPLWGLSVWLTLPGVVLVILGDLALDGSSVALLFSFLVIDGLALAGAAKLRQLLREGDPHAAFEQWQSLSREVERYLDGGHSQIALGQSVLHDNHYGNQLVLKGPGYWAFRLAQFNASLGLVKDELIALESSEEGTPRLRIWAGTAGLVGRGPQSWLLEFGPDQWPKIEKYLRKEHP